MTGRVFLLPLRSDILFLSSDIFNVQVGLGAAFWGVVSGSRVKCNDKTIIECERRRRSRVDIDVDDTSSRGQGGGASLGTIKNETWREERSGYHFSLLYTEVLGGLTVQVNGDVAAVACSRVS